MASKLYSLYVMVIDGIGMMFIILLYMWLAMPPSSVKRLEYTRHIPSHSHSHPILIQRYTIDGQIYKFQLKLNIISKEEEELKTTMLNRMVGQMKMDSYVHNGYDIIFIFIIVVVAAAVYLVWNPITVWKKTGNYNLLIAENVCMQIGCMENVCSIYIQYLIHIYSSFWFTLHLLIQCCCYSRNTTLIMCGLYWFVFSPLLLSCIQWCDGR